MKIYLTIVTKLILINVVLLQNVPHYLINLPEDGRLNFTGLATKYINGRDCEVYDITTDDGYILKLFHIPGDRNRPVLIMHGILDAADTFIIRGNNSLTAVLAEEDYDIWIGNSRGSRYSRRHVSLNPNTEKAFWQFSFHELGYYDLPAMIDFILNKTGAKQLNAIGHSQGNQIFYVLGATRPEYNSKIKLLIALAPICYLHHVTPPVKDLVGSGQIINNLLTVIGMEEVLGDFSLERKLIDLLCLHGSSGYKMCVEGVLFTLAGRDPGEFEPEFYRTVLAHFPTGTSRENAVHLLQVAQNEEFANFDHGLERNLIVYNTTLPPKYDLNKVTMKVAMLAGRNDRLSSLKDVNLLRKSLPNVIEYRLLDRVQFNHMDFNWGRNNRKNLFPHILTLLKT